MGNTDAEKLSKQEDEPSGCHCSTATGFLLVLLAAILAVGVGIIVHFAGKPDREVTCKFNLTGLVASSLERSACIASARNNDLEICSACPGQTATVETTSISTTKAPKTYNARLPVNVKPVSYQLYIRPDFYSGNTSEFTFYGYSSVVVTCEKETAEIVMHVKDLLLAENSITVRKENSVDNLYLSHELVEEPQFVVIKLTSSLEKGENYVISFANFSAPVRSDFTGLYRGMYSENGVDSHYVMTQMEVVEARKVFPCFDEPAMKATFQLTIPRKPGYVTITNSPLDSTRTVNGWVEEKFAVTPIMPTYLLAIIVGDFVSSQLMSANNIVSRVYSKPSARNQATYALDVGARILTSMENYFGIPFPIPKQDMTAINAFQFNAMENWGAIVFREDRVLYDEKMTSFRAKYWIAHVISHEISHNWFGNLVSPAWWDDLWLNEGFATFVTFNGLHAVHPEWNVEEWFLADIMVSAFQADGVKSAHPIYIPGVEDPNGILQYFDAISYRKGASVIRMMEYVIGKETFKRGLKNYLAKHSFSNARHQDLFNALGEQAAAENITIDVQGFMSEYIYQMGFPIVNVEYTEEGKILLSQKRLLFNDDAKDPGIFKSDYGYKWTIPFTFTSSQEKDFSVTSDRFVMMQPQEASVEISSDTIPAPSGDVWLIGNLKASGFFTVNYDERNWNAIMTQLVTDHTVIDPLNRLQIITDSWNLVKSGDLDISIALRTLDYIGKETHPAHILTLSRRIDYLIYMFNRFSFFGEFSEYMKDSLSDLYTKVGFTASGQADPMTQSREIVTKLACYFGNEDCLDRAQTIFAEWMANPSARPSDLSADNAFSVYCTGVMNGGEEEFNFLYEKFNKETFASERSTLLSAMACTKHPFLIIRYLKMALKPGVIAREKTLISTALLRNSMMQSAVWDCYRLLFDQFHEKLGSYWNMFFLSNIAKVFMCDHRAKELKELGKEKNLGKYGSFRVSLENAEANVKWADKNGPTVENWLKTKSV